MNGNSFYVNHTQALSVGMNWAEMPSIFKIPIETEQLNKTNENGVMKWYRPLSSKAQSCHSKKSSSIPLSNKRVTEKNLGKLFTVVRA